MAWELLFLFNHFTSNMSFMLSMLTDACSILCTINDFFRSGFFLFYFNIFKVILTFKKLTLWDRASVTSGRLRVSRGFK